MINDIVDGDGIDNHKSIADKQFVPILGSIELMKIYEPAM